MYLDQSSFCNEDTVEPREPQKEQILLENSPPFPTAALLLCLWPACRGETDGKTHRRRLVQTSQFKTGRFLFSCSDFCCDTIGLAVFHLLLQP